MKRNEKTSGKSSSKRSLTPLPAPKTGHKHVPLLALGATVAMLLLGGCASDRVQRDSDPWTYNNNTGYPAVGGPRWDF